MSVSRIRPSPAMIVALIALVAAVSGSAYAALSKNSVGTKQLKKGAVRTSDLRNDAVTGKKAKESTFAKVPSAKSADTADTANVANIASVANSFGGMSAQSIAPFTLGNGGSRVVGVFGPFTLTATCTINLAGTDLAEIVATTSENNSAYIGESEDADFDVGDSLPYVEASTLASGTPAIDEDSAMVASPSGTEILGHQLYAGVNLFGQPGACRYGGVVFVT